MSINFLLVVTIYLLVASRCLYRNGLREPYLYVKVDLFHGYSMDWTSADTHQGSKNNLLRVHSYIQTGLDDRYFAFCQLHGATLQELRLLPDFQSSWFNDWKNRTPNDAPSNEHDTDNSGTPGPSNTKLNTA